MKTLDSILGAEPTWRALQFGLLVAALAFALGGCTTQYGELARQTIAEQGRKEAAAAVNDLEWGLCRAAPVGAVVDRYGRSESLWDAWTTICLPRFAVAEPPAIVEPGVPAIVEPGVPE